MTPGPDIIRKCSGCGKLIVEHTINSGNTFGARFWTDGKRDMPMLPDSPWLVKCEHCGELVWIDEQEQVGEIEPWGLMGENDDKFKDALPFATPSLQDYLTALSKGVPEKGKEKYIRLRAWWAGNDVRRETDRAEAMRADELTNLSALVQLLAEDDENDRIMKAEAKREQGLFEEAENLLSSPFSKDVTHAVAIIRDLVERRISVVMEIKF